MTASLSTLTDRHNIDVLDHLDREALVPIVTGLQRQGDVIVIPTSGMDLFETSAASPWAKTLVPATGIPVVRGEAGGNTHAIVAEGDVYCDVRAASATNLTLATLTVTEGATAYLAHPEHGYSGIGPGTYELRRQREQADELRMVQD